MRLLVGHRRYRVAAMTAADHTTRLENGLCDETGGRLLVWPGVSPCEQADALMHETLHAVWRAWELPAKAAEEEAVTRLAHGLCQVIRDNPAFVPALLAGLKDDAPLFAAAEEDA